MSKHRRADADAEIAEYLRRNPELGVKDDGRNHAAPCRLTEVRDVHPQREAPRPVAQSIVLPLPPSANRYWRSYRGRVTVSEDAKTYKRGVAMAATHAGFRPYTCAVAVRLHVYRARKAGDLDNFAKVTLDALRGIAYNDDDQIVELHLWRHDDKNNPRIEVEIREAAHE